MAVIISAAAFAVLVVVWIVGYLRSSRIVRPESSKAPSSRGAQTEQVYSPDPTQLVEVAEGERIRLAARHQAVHTGASTWSRCDAAQ